MFFKNPLDKKFAQWGKGKKVLPSNASMMKEKFLSSAELSSSPVKQMRPPKFYFKILSLGLAVVVLFVGVSEYRKNSRIAMVGGQSSGWYEGGFTEEKSVAPTAPAVYNQSAQDLGIQSGEVTALGRQDGVGGVVDMVANGAKSIAREFVQPEYNQNRYNPTPTSINDTREFSKFSYNSTLKTRDVEDISTRILTTIRGYGGRVDDASLQEKYSYISFVVPKANLLQFKTEIKGMVGKKFYVESLHIQNLLPEKVGIEDSTKTYSKLLSDAQEKLKDLNEKHAKTIAGLQRDLNNINGRIAKLKAEVTSDPERQKQIKTEISNLVVRQRAVQKQIADENTWYGWDSTRLEQDVKNNQTQLDSLGTQEKNLVDTVETVQGYVSVQWMSLWEMINIYIPYLWAWVVGLCFLLLIFNYFSKRRTINAW
jgi:hypothetical protein